MDSSNSFPVRYRLIELPRDFGPYKKGQVWADPDLEHAAQLMLTVFHNRTEAAKIAQKGREDVYRLLSPAAVGGRMCKRLVSTGLLEDDDVPGVHECPTSRTIDSKEDILEAS
jgi:hypothetical protein